MKIVGIERASTHRHHIAFRTNPPLTSEVFQRFVQAVGADDYRQDGTLLVYTGVFPPPTTAIQNTELLLTKAEGFLANRKNVAENEQEGFAKKVSEVTGLPLL